MYLMWITYLGYSAKCAILAADVSTFYKTNSEEFVIHILSMFLKQVIAKTLSPKVRSAVNTSLTTIFDPNCFLDDDSFSL